LRQVARCDRWRPVWRRGRRSGGRGACGGCVRPAPAGRRASSGRSPIRRIPDTHSSRAARRGSLGWGSSGPTRRSNPGSAGASRRRLARVGGGEPVPHR
jgi:hypothetical protein